VLGVTESRVCQLHTQAVARLRATMVDSAGTLNVAKRRGRKPKTAQPASG
jgi:RNA polymerase sigma factor for flagellar operon FliA